MRAHAARHLKGNIWHWIGGLFLAGAAFVALRWGTPAAFCFMLAGLFIILADQHVDPLALVTEDALHPEEAELPGSTAAQGTPAAKEPTLAVRAVLVLPTPLVDTLPAWSALAA